MTKVRPRGLINTFLEEYHHYALCHNRQVYISCLELIKTSVQKEYISFVRDFVTLILLGFRYFFSLGTLEWISFLLRYKSWDLESTIQQWEYIVGLCFE
jgi:hypothetical protein